MASATSTIVSVPLLPCDGGATCDVVEVEVPVEMVAGDEDMLEGDVKVIPSFSANGPRGEAAIISLNVPRANLPDRAFDR